MPRRNDLPLDWLAFYSPVSSNGKTVASQATNVGSIPIARSNFFSGLTKTEFGCVRAAAAL
jgi:hypothetical protein